MSDPHKLVLYAYSATILIVLPAFGGIVMVPSSTLNCVQSLPLSDTDFSGSFPGVRRRSLVVAGKCGPSWTVAVMLRCLR